ncbi:hypothetical protein AgCh_012093 [Apium graveolens]
MICRPARLKNNFEKSDYSAEDISSIAKDAKVRHLLHSAIDNVMSNRIINCKTAKEIWDDLETRCQETDSIKKNRKTILAQEYEHFDSKPDESLTDLYDRFVKLLNDLSLVDKEYDIEDSNLKFLLALPERWDLKAIIIRDNYNLDETILDEIYGMLKTHELKMEQRSKRNGRKSRTVAFVAEEESPKEAASRKGKGKALITKSDTESSSSDSDDDSETESIPEMDPDEEMMKLCAPMKGFRKSEGKGGKSDRGDYSNVKFYNCGEKCHISPDCRKGKSDKGKTLVTKKKSWSDASNSEDEENYALMENADSSSDTADLKVPQTIYAFHTDDITELRRYLKTMFIIYKDQTLTCERLTSENLTYKKRNDYLEKELVMFHQTQKDRDDAFYVRDGVLKMNESLKIELEKERDIIRTWTNSGKATQDILSSGNWKEGLGYGDDKNKVKEKVTSDKPKQDKPTEVNIGLMTKKQLKHKLKDVKKSKHGHMTRNKALLSDFMEKAGPGISYGDGNIGKTLGYGNINLGNVIIEKVALVSGLKHNLLSVSQICDRGYHVDLFEEHCEVVSKSTGKVVLKEYMHGNIYEAKLSTSTDGSAICLLSRASIEESWDWHKKLSHLNFININELVKKDLVRGLPKSVFAPDGFCDSCQKAKQRKSSFKSKTESSILEPYHLLHVDLFGPVNVMSIAKKKYAMVIVDEFTRYTWVYFLHTKSETASILINHVKQLDKLVKDSVNIIRSDNGTEFKNLIMEEFCKDHGIKQEFFAPGTPQ